DMVIWSDDQLPGLTELADIIKAHGSIPAIQIGHGGRKASSQRPWEGNQPLALHPSGADTAWQTVGASALPIQEGWPASRELKEAELAEPVESFRAATLRSVSAGYQFVQLHAAHWYLLHSYLSPISHHRHDP